METLGKPVVTSAPRLEAAQISRAFHGMAVVQDLSLTVASGQVLCLLGPSGCGKSTTLRMIAGVETADSGTICIDGVTVAGTVGFGLRGDAAAKARRVGELLERVNLQGFAAKHPHELSGGEQQRVALARALAPRPKVMLMDEPFSGLDNRLRDGIRDTTLEILREEGAAVVLVTHEPDEAMRMADEIVLMRGGRMVQRGAPYNIYNAPADRAAAAFFSDINVIRGTSRGALTQTPFGAFLTPGHADGAEVEIVIRPQHLKIDFDRAGRGPNPTPQDGTAARGTVARARYLGRESLVDFRMDFDGSILTASVPGVFMPKTGTPLWLMIRRDRCFVFPASQPIP